jgi:hypothetical protein
MDEKETLAQQERAGGRFAAWGARDRTKALDGTKPGQVPGETLT